MSWVGSLPLWTENSGLGFLGKRCGMNLFLSQNSREFVNNWCSNMWMGMATICSDGNDSNFAILNLAKWQLQYGYKLLFILFNLIDKR